MFDFLNNLTNGQALFICLLIFLFVLIFPRLLRKKRIANQLFEKKQKGESIRPEDFSGKKKLFYTHNGKSHEIEGLLVKIKFFAHKHNMKIIFPGGFSVDHTISPTTMILVGKFGILLIRCYGFGGHIYWDEKKKCFMQNMNESLKEIPNPHHSMKQERRLLQNLLKETDFYQTSILTASVFTRSNIILSVPESYMIFDRKNFLLWLKNESVFSKDNKVPVDKITDFLVHNIKETHIL